MAKFEFLGDGALRIVGLPDYYARWTVRNQLLDRNAWRHFIEAFRTSADSSDHGWRGEYWGKMMRGASLMQAYTGDEELYGVLCDAVVGLLDSQDAEGRFSSYSKETEFSGWDVWARKYVMTGLMHFRNVCRDEQLKERIVAALCRHADYITVRVGDGEDKIAITKTSNAWLGVNSASILEPFVELYKITSNTNYLDFAKHIISTGGCTGGDLVSLALEDKLRPFEYPETKAYETMSFFEGVLAYYEVTGEKRYFDAVVKFVEAVNESDITIIGCAGCTHELFDNSSLKQTEYSETIMQETCVTVTWMRLLARMLAATGDVRYADRIERSALNALYGSVNINMIDQLDICGATLVKGLPFESYSPLFNNKRGRGIGGFKRYPDGFYYGCCACISAAAMALYPRLAVMRSNEGFAVNWLYSGYAAATTPNGGRIAFAMEGRYPQDTSFKLSVSLDSTERFTISLRVPPYAIAPKVSICGESKEVATGYLLIDREWSDGDVISLEFDKDLVETDLNGKVAFELGPLVLARDCNKEEKQSDLTLPLNAIREADGKAKWEPLQPEGFEMARISIAKADGSSILLTDYASCGKNWNDDNNLMTVWMNP